MINKRFGLLFIMVGAMSSTADAVPATAWRVGQAGATVGIGYWAYSSLFNKINGEAISSIRARHKAFVSGVKKKEAAGVRIEPDQSAMAHMTPEKRKEYEAEVERRKIDQNARFVRYSATSKKKDPQLEVERLSKARSHGWVWAIGTGLCTLLVAQLVGEAAGTFDPILGALAKAHAASKPDAASSTRRP